MRIRSFEQLQAIGVVVVEQKIPRTTTTATAKKRRVHKDSLPLSTYLAYLDPNKDLR